MLSERFIFLLQNFVFLFVLPEVTHFNPEKLHIFYTFFRYQEARFVCEVTQVTHFPDNI